MDRFEFFARLPRIEPGCATFTSQYLTKVPLKASDRILDLAAGAGQRATWVARSRGSRIVTVERDPRFLPHVMQTAREGGERGEDDAESGVLEARFQIGRHAIGLHHRDALERR